MNSETAPLAAYLEVLFARARPSTLIELRWRTSTGMARCFIPVSRRHRLVALARDRARSTDVFVGVLPRWRPRGGRSAVVGDGRTVWVDLDTEVAARALEPVEPPPNLTVASGGVGHLHAYWTLVRAVPPAVIERANRRMAWALGGDLGSTDAARILRPPQSIHHGRGLTPVRLAGVAPDGLCWLGELVGGLPDPPHRAVAVGRPAARQRATRGDALLGLAPERYVSELTGQRVPRSRKVRCPLHEDQTPSLHVYPDPARGWFCFGCRRGGSIYDLAGALWRIEPRGSGFVALRDALQARFDPRSCSGE